MVQSSGEHFYTPRRDDPALPPLARVVSTIPINTMNIRLSFFRGKKEAYCFIKEDTSGG